MATESGPGDCLTCGRTIDESRALETNYLHGEFGKPGGPQEWFACGGCLSVFRITWEPIRGIGNDSWAMFPTNEILIPGAAVAHVIERLQTTIAEGESARALAELSGTAESWRLMEIPEVIAAAWPAFRGRAITTTHLAFPVTSMKYADPIGGEWCIPYPIVRLRDETPEIVERLLREPDVNGFRKPKRHRGSANASALMTLGTRVLLAGSSGPLVHVRPASPMWEHSGELSHFEVTLERLALDPASP